MRMIISAGGTGGHIYPAVAIINKFKELESNTEIIYIGTHDRMEKDIIPPMGIRYESLEIYGFSKQKILRNIKNLFLINKAKKKCLKIMKDFKPDIVLGIGGYVTYPVVKAAKELGIKIFLHEQNSIPGKTNLFLAKGVDLVGVSFAESAKNFKKAKRVEYTGNPCGENARNISIVEKETLGFNINKKLVIIVCGSLGSGSVNNKMKDFLTSLEDEFVYEILYITGKDHYEEFVKDAKFPYNVKVVPYFDNLPGIMKAADLIVTRAGASTISEILALELPAIFIPSPYVANNHQYYNAMDIKNHNAAEVIEEKDLTVELLRNKINAILNTPEKYYIMKDNLRSLGKINSSAKIYELIKDVLK